MAASSSSNSAKNNITPQATGGGFSQVHARGGGGGEGGGQAMSVLLSWHEKVRFVSSVLFFFSRFALSKPFPYFYGNITRFRYC